MAIVFFASSNCVLRWSICADINPSSLAFAWAFAWAFLASTPVSIPVSIRGLAPGVTREVDPLGFFP